MLLPSALPCGGESRVPLPRLQMPPSRFAPIPAPRSPALANSLLSSCRALQALLGGVSSSQPASIPRHVDRPQRLASPLHARPLAARPARAVQPKAKIAPPRGANKRRRHEYEEDNGIAKRDVCDGASLKPFSTPKRQRRVPLNMPLGLSAEDFVGLETPPTSDAETQHESDSADAQCFTAIGDLKYGKSATWTTQDDEQLVGLVLEKFKLSRRQWTECARKIGKDGQSVEERWKLLVGRSDYVQHQAGVRRGGKRARAQICEDWREGRGSICRV